MRSSSSLTFALTRGGLSLTFLLAAVLTAEGCDCGDILNPIADSGPPPAACALSDSDACEGNLVLKQGECRPSGCELDSDCCPGTRCRLDLNACFPHVLDGEYACEDDADCPDPAQRCQEVAIGPRDPLPICVFERCTGDVDCGEGRTCFHSVCVQNTPCGGGCADGEVCDVLSGQCSVAPTGSVGCDATCDGLMVLADPDLMAGDICCPTVCQCKQLPPIVPRRFGRFSRIAMSGAEVVVSAYDAEFGDLVLVHYKADGGFSRIDYLDGIPAGGDVLADPLGPRGGVREPGPNVGTHTSIASDASGRLRIAYHDEDNASLKVAVQIPGGWTNYTLDNPAGEGGRLGRFTDVAVDQADGTVWVSYLIDHVTGTPGIAGPANGLKIARSLNDDPRSPADWQFFFVDTREPLDSCAGQCGAGEVCVLDGGPTCRATAPTCPSSCNGGEECIALDAPDADGNTSACFPPPLPLAPEGLPRARGLHSAIVAESSGALVSYYDSIDGDLRLARLNAQGAAELWVLDGDGQDGRRTGDVGRFPSVAVSGDQVMVVYTDFARHQLRMWRGSPGAAGERLTLDNGLVQGSTGLRFVGAGGRIALTPSGPLIVYQDASNLDLKLAEEGEAGFTTQVLLQEGAHGFYSDLVVSESAAFVVSVQARVDARGQEASRLSVLPRPLP